MFTKNFRRGDLRRRAIANLQEQEMSLLPATLEILQAEKTREKYYLKTSELKQHLSAIETQLLANPQDLVNFQFILDIQKDLCEIGYVAERKKKKDNLRRSVKCPREECRGFIYKSGLGANVCALCDHKLCSHCNSSIGLDDHVCNDADIASWHLIRDSTVPCPKCSTNIEKISGCNQMWCTMKDCNTAFDWVSGKVINGPVHNPHYHQWLSQGGAQVNNPNILCDAPGEIYSSQKFSFIYSMLDHSCSRSELAPHYSICKQYLRVLPELAYIFTREIVYGPDTHINLRLEYLKGTITKDEWRTKLSHRETLRIKDMRISALHQMLRAAASDIFLQFYREIRKISMDDNFLSTSNERVINPRRIEPVLTTFNDSMENLRKYHIQESCRVISDYSDATVNVLEFISSGNEKYLVWGRQNVSNLLQLYF
jgi:hypothetical protein